MPSDKPSMLIISFFSFIPGTQICMQELQISLKCNNAKCSWSVNDKSMHNTSLKEEGSEGMDVCRGKNGSFIPNHVKNTASASPSAQSHLWVGLHEPFSPSFPQLRIPARPYCPHCPGLSCRLCLQCNDSKWGEHHTPSSSLAASFPLESTADRHQ